MITLFSKVCHTIIEVMPEARITNWKLPHSFWIFNTIIRILLLLLTIICIVKNKCNPSPNGISEPWE